MGLISVGVCVVGFVTDMMVVVEGYGGGRCRFVRALFVGWNENGLVTSRGPGLHGRLERERERERMSNVLFIKTMTILCYTIPSLYPCNPN